MKQLTPEDIVSKIESDPFFDFEDRIAIFNEPNRLTYVDPAPDAKHVLIYIEKVDETKGNNKLVEDQIYGILGHLMDEYGVFMVADEQIGESTAATYNQNKIKEEDRLFAVVRLKEKKDLMIIPGDTAENIQENFMMCRSGHSWGYNDHNMLDNLVERVGTSTSTLEAAAYGQRHYIGIMERVEEWNEENPDSKISLVNITPEYFIKKGRDAKVVGALACVTGLVLVGSYFLS